MLQKALAANTPTEAEKTLAEELTKQLEKSDLQPPGTSITEALQLCTAAHNKLPVKITNPDQLKPRLRQILTAYDNGATGTQNYAICITKQTKKVLDLPKTCYGTYIDKQYINKILGPKTLTAFTGTCIASLIACEAATKLLAGPALAAAEAGAVCGLPALTATLTKNQIAEEIKKTGEITRLGEAKLLAPLVGVPLGGVLTLYPTARRAAQLYLESKGAEATGKLGKAARRIKNLWISEKWAQKIVEDYTKRLQKMGIPGIRGAEDTARLLANSKPQDIAILGYLSNQVASGGKQVQNELRETLKDLVNALKEDKRLEFYRTILQNTELRKMIGIRPDYTNAIKKVIKNYEAAITRRLCTGGECKINTVGVIEDLSNSKDPEELQKKLQQYGLSDLKDEIINEVDELAEKTLEEGLDDIAEALANAKDLAEVEKILTERGVPKEVIDKLTKASKAAEESTLRKFLKGAICSGIAYAAGTLTASKLVATPFFTDIPTLTIELTQNTIKVGNITIGG